MMNLDKFMITNESYATAKSLDLSLSYAKNLGASKVYLRDKNLSSEILSRFLVSCEKYGLMLFINYISGLLSSDVAIHLKSDEIEIARDLRGDMVISCSAHNMCDILNAHNLGVNYIMISPIFFVKSKSTPLGIDFIKQIPDDIKPKIYALGGINQSNINQFRGLGIGGVAGIRMFIRGSND